MNEPENKKNGIANESTDPIVFGNNESKKKSAGDKDERLVDDKLIGDDLDIKEAMDNEVKPGRFKEQDDIY